MLIERSGEVVLRSDIQQKLWPEAVPGDLDQSINAAVSGLRTTLGDASDQPVYIETLFKRGYRFLAAVEWIGDTPIPEPPPPKASPNRARP